MEFSTQAMVIDYGCWRLSVILQYENEVLCLFDEWEEWEAASVKKKKEKKKENDSWWESSQNTLFTSQG